MRYAVRSASHRIVGLTLQIGEDIRVVGHKVQVDRLHILTVDQAQRSVTRS